MTVIIEDAKGVEHQYHITRKGYRFLVRGQKSYYVDVRKQTCTCPHFTYRETACKHLEACNRICS